MEQLDKEVIDELSEPAKRVFRSLDYRSQRRMLKKAKEMGKQKKRKTQQKERIKKKSITKKQIKKEQAKERGSSTKRNQSRTASFGNRNQRYFCKDIAGYAAWNNNE